MKRKTLKKILLTGALGFLTFFPNLSNGNASIVPSQIPQSMSQFYDFNEDGMVKTFKNKSEGEKKIKEHEERMNSSFSNLKTTPPEGFADFSLNYFLPGWESNLTNKNWYGSGDMDGDNDIDEDDYTYSLTQPVSFNPFNDGTHRADLNMNGQSYDSEDIQILYEYLTGERTHINVWELETAAEQESHFRKALDIDPTNLINANSANWLCYNFTSQLFINFNGNYDISNSSFAEDNGTNLQYDLSHNGIFRIPLKFASTYTGNNIPHEINVTYISRLGNENVRNFDYRIYVEPQTDEFQTIGDFCLIQFAKEFWKGYYYNNFLNQWRDGGVNLCEYSFSSSQPILTDYPEGLIETFNALEGITFLPNKTLQYYPGIEDDLAAMVQTELPTNIPYPDYTFVERNSSSNQEANGAEKYNFDFNISTYILLGKFNSNNSLGGVNVQKVSVEDNEAPNRDSVTGTWSDSSGGNVEVTYRTDTTNRSCDGFGTAREYEKGTDVSGNALEVLLGEEDFDDRIMPTYFSSPGDIEYTGNPNDDNPLPDLTGAPVFSHPTGDVDMFYADETVREAYGEKDIKRTFWGESSRSDCERSQDTVQYIYVRSGVGIEEPISIIESIAILRNPAKGNLRIAYTGDGRINLDSDIYNLNGRMVRDTEPSYMNKGEARNISLSGLSSGLYLLKLKDMDSGKIGVKKIVVSN